MLVSHLPCPLPPNQSVIWTCPLPQCHRVTMSPCHRITMPPCHRITLSLCHCVTVSPHHCTTASVHHRITMSLHHHITASDFPHHMGMNLVNANQHSSDWLIVPTTANQITGIEKPNYHKTLIFFPTTSLKWSHEARIDELADSNEPAIMFLKSNTVRKARVFIPYQNAQYALLLHFWGNKEAIKWCENPCDVCEKRIQPRSFAAEELFGFT